MLPPRFSALALPLLLIGCADEVQAPDRPDVVLVVCDTLRSDRLGCYGYPRATSPIIDSLAAGGVVFEDNTCQWPWTLPSMVSLFEGRYVTAYRDKLEEHVPSLPEIFRDAGYITVGLAANCLVDESQGFDRGFDHFDGLNCWDENGERDPSGRNIEQLSELALEAVRDVLVLDEKGQRRPLFLYLHAYDPHDPYSPHPQFKQALPTTESGPPSPPEYWRETFAQAGNGYDKDKLTADLAFLTDARGRYDQEVRYFDLKLGKLLADLQGLGVNRDALTALVSDHGEGLWEHLRNEPQKRLMKRSPKQFFYQTHGGNSYQTVMATPFLMWGRGVPSGVRISQGTENVDLIPTLLELADIAPPEGLDGHSLVPLMSGDGVSPREYVYCYGSHGIAIRHLESGYKLIIPSGRSIDSQRPMELFNLKEDPHERRNVAKQNPEWVKRLADEYTHWMAANPTTSSTKVDRHNEQNAEDRARLKAKMEALGYTGLETGE